jgi:hypothetical protein
MAFLQGQARKLLNGGLPVGQEALKAATARPWVAFGSIAASKAMPRSAVASAPAPALQPQLFVQPLNMR